MYLINPQLNGSNLSNQSYNDILTGIDRTILCMATTEYHNETLGFKDYVDMNIYDNLCDYREILMSIWMGCGCLQNEHLIEIIYKVKKLTN